MLISMQESKTTSSRIRSTYGSEELKRHFDNFDPEQGRYRFVTDHLPENARVLEVGCFLGRYCNYLKERGFDACGVDLSEEALLKARELFPGLDLRKADACKLEEAGFEENSFDAIVASEVIEHLLDPTAFLLGAARLLKKGGVLMLTTQNSNAAQFRARMLLGCFRWDPTHLRLYSRPELEDELQSGGFEPQSFHPIPVNPKGPGKIFRFAATLAGRVFSNMCWTWGVIAKVRKGAES